MLKKRLKKGVFIQPCSVKPATWLQFLSAAAGNSASTVIKYARPAFPCRVYFQHCCTQKWDKGCNTVWWVKKKTLIWTQNDYLQRCFLLHEIDLHAAVILLLLSSPFFFFFFFKFQAGVSKQHRWRRQHLPAEPCFKPSDCPRHAEYACGLWCSEKMGMNNKRYCDNAVGHWAAVLLSPHLPSTCEWKRHQNKITPLCKKKEKKKKEGTLTFLHFRWPCGYFHLQFKWIRQYNDFKSLLCQSECYREERRRNRGEK